MATAVARVPVPRADTTVAAPTTRSTTATSSTTATRSPRPPRLSPTNYALIEAKLFDKINAYRAQHGARPVARHGGIDSVARNWSANMARSNHMSHNPNFRSQIPRGWSTAGENVAFYAGYGNEEKVAQVLFTLWINSPGHRANLLKPQYTHAGMGVGKAANGTFYATQDFARY